MRELTPNPTKMEDPLLQELLQIADYEAPGELGSRDLQLLVQPLLQWKNVQHPVSFCIPAVLSECVLLKNRTWTILTIPIKRMNCVAGFSDILDTLYFGTLGDQTVVWYVAKSLECACISSAHMHHRVSVLICVCLSHPMLALQPMMQFQSNTNSFSATIALKLNKQFH